MGRLLWYPLHAGFFFLVLLFVLHVHTGRVNAGGIGNPVADLSPESHGRIALDYERGEPDIESDQSGFHGGSREERILLKYGLGLNSAIDLFIRLGLAAHETPSRNFNGSFGPAYGAGLKWIVYKTEAVSAGMGIQILEFHTKDDRSAFPRLRWDEVDVFFGGVFEKVEWMRPYGGFLFSIGRGKFKQGPRIELESLGDLFIGAEFLYKRLHFVSELRLIHENGLTFSVGYSL
ncbi:MAG: hypothetical protein ACE5GK_08420 [Nitrospiria bacterium]